ncbi:MAG: TetR/AcrR family transcriptional regulator [Spirochaetaceae bacterium]|nr:TetR/AcrR family transcriptional regulator [Spirochaetaceae bacterium]
MSKADRSGLPTEEQLLDAAVGLFAQKWYGTVSVAEICRSAGLSNGVFYRYFENKEVLFKRILERVLELLKTAVEGASGAGPKERLEDLEERVLRFSAEHPDLVSVFREGQYRYFDYERRLVALYLRALGQALGRGVELAEYLFALGGLRFCATQRVYNGAAIDPASILAIVEKGLFRGMDFDPELVFGGTATPLPLPLDQDARARLLKSGKRLFGEKGYYETNIHDVTGAAGLSVGAFYTYFASKEVFYAEIIEMVGKQVRGFIARNLAPAAGPKPLNRLERELRGLWLWLVYLSIDKDCYAIVREAEFVLPDAVRDYYGRFVAGYRKNPEGNAAPGSGIDDGTAIEFLLGVAHYAGIEVAFDESPVNARAVVEAIGRYLGRGFSEYLS